MGVGAGAAQEGLGWQAAAMPAFVMPAAEKLGADANVAIGAALVK